LKTFFGLEFGSRNKFLHIEQRPKVNKFVA
jgi:hypothetical protein